MCPALSGAIALLRSGNATTLPSSVTSRRCVATPAPPAVCSEVNGTFGTVAVRMSPDSRDLPTTWIVAVPLKLATPPEIVTGPITVPWTRICAMLAQGPNANPPDRPAITHRNSPPDDEAVNPTGVSGHAVPFAHVLAARAVLATSTRPTPPRHRDAVSPALGLDVWPTCEHALPTAAFKARGGLTLLGRDPTSRNGVTAASTGNHG